MPKIKKKYKSEVDVVCVTPKELEDIVVKEFSSGTFDTITAYKEAMIQENKIKNLIHDSMPFGLERDIVNLEKLYEEDRKDGISFNIDTSISYTNIDNESTYKDSDSIFSHKFSFRSNDTAYANSKRFRCICGSLESDTAGLHCDKCLSYTADRPATRGWIVLKNYKVFNPYFLELFVKYLKKGINKTIFKSDIYSTNNFSYNKDGDRIPRSCKYNILDLQNESTLRDFIEEYANPEDKQIFLNKIQSAMTNKIPVINRDYRHYSVTKKLNGKSNVASHPTNKLYIQIAGAVNAINNFKGKESRKVIVAHLSKVNKSFVDLKDELISVMADSKKADIRAKIGARRPGKSARNVLEGIMNHQIDVCSLPYRYFGVMTIDEHIDLYQKYGLTPEAEHRMRHSHPNKNDKILMTKVLKDLIKLGLNTCIICRSPTIYRESVVSLRIIGLVHDATIHCNEIMISECLHGDKDGDIVSIYLVKKSIRKSLHFALSPKKGFYDPISGFVNGGFELPESVYFICYKALECKPKDKLEEVLLTEDDIPRSYEFDPNLSYE